MRALFPVLARRLGTRRGHLTGFAVYWTFCYLLPLGLLGRIAERLFLTAYLRRFLEARNRELKAVAESSVWVQFIPPPPSHDIESR